MTLAPGRAMGRAMTKILILGLALLPLAACGSQPQSGQDAKQTSAADNRPASFGACSVCHATEAGRNGVGPTLHGVVGRQAGTMPNYTYSPAMKNSAVIWDAVTLDRFIAAPHDVVPGTRMAYPGMRDAAKRAQIVDYLATLK